jgi:diguanylate cyclase (GGDEF)-like protein
VSKVFAGAVLDALPDATAVVDQRGTIVAVNHTWRMFAADNGGSPQTTGVGVNYLDLCHRSAAAGCEDAHTAATALRAVLAGDTMQSDLEYPCPSPAARRWFLMRVTPIVGTTPTAVVSHVNITRRKMAEEVLAHQAAHDPLTGLANRTLFVDRLTHALTPRSGRPASGDVGVMYLDLDSFKAINDTYGHDAGDEVLLTTAHRLRDQVRPQDTVARLGGDEFAVTAPRISAEALAALAQRISAALNGAQLVHAHSLVIAASIGTHLATQGETAEDALRLADRAMYTVKRTRASLTSNGSAPRVGAT